MDDVQAVNCAASRAQTLRPSRSRPKWHSLAVSSVVLCTFLLVNLSSHLVLCNQSANEINHTSPNFTLIKSVHDNYNDGTTEMTTEVPDNNSAHLGPVSTGPSDVEHDGWQDRLGNESKEKRDADDKDTDNDEDATSATSANTDSEEKVAADDGDQSKASKLGGEPVREEDEDEEEEEDDGEHGGNSSTRHSSADANKKSDDDEDEEEGALKPRMIKLDRKPSHRSREDEDHSNETSDVEEDDDDDDDDDDEDYDDADRFATNVCTAEYFLDKIIPEDFYSTESKDVRHINETIERLNRMYNFSNQLMQKMNPFFREMASRITDFLYEAQLEPSCLGSLFRLLKGINERKPWALSFLDATGPLLTGGYRQGKFVSLGEFDQCLDTMTELPEENVNNEPIRGQYCLIKPIIPVPAEHRFIQGEPVAKSNIATVNRFLNDEYIETYLGLYKFLKNTILRIGVCFPAQCDPTDVENALNKFLIRKTGLSVKVGPNCVKSTDQTELNTYQIVSLFIFGVLTLLVISSTLVELVYRLFIDSSHYFPTSPRSSIIPTPFSLSFSSSNPQNTAKYLRQASILSVPYIRQPLKIQVFTMFSAIRNTRVLFEIPPYRKLPLDTMRLLLIFFFFISNAYIYTIVFAPMVIKRFYVLGPIQLATEKKYFFLRLYYMLDIFLAFSGISAALAFKSNSFSYFKWLIQNYLRYAVPILFSVGLIYIVPAFGSGPLWHLFEQTITHNCKSNLWSTLFFYNNLNESIEEICNLPTTFVSLIFQMQILIAPLLLIIGSQFRSKYTTIIFLSTMFVAASVANLIPRFVFDYKLPYEYQGMKSFTEIKTSVMFYNFHPLVHVSPFIFGLLVGNLINSQPITRYSHCMAVGLVSLFGFICGFIYMENLDMKAPNLSTFEIISMLTFGRIPMLTFFCWIVYACLNGCIVIVKRFLSSIVWRPLAQLSYGFYVTSIIVTAYRLFSIRETTTLAAANMFRAIVSDALVAFVFSYLIHITAMQPLRNLRQVLLHWKQLFDVKSSAALNTDHGTFTKVAEETESHSGGRKQSIILDIPQNTSSRLASAPNKSDSNNNDI